VAITHQETEEDLALARALPALDVIIGGHTQGFDGLIPPGDTTAVEGRIELAGGGPIFVKTHRQGRTLGRLDLLYHDRTIMVAEARNVPVDAKIQSDPAVSELVQGYVRRMKQETGRAIGHLHVDLEGEAFTIRTRETNLGNLLADLAREHTGAEVALINAGTVRSSLASGVVTYGHIMEVLPFDSSLSLLTLTGAQLRSALENSVSRLPEANGRFLQVSGLRYAVDPTAPIGGRVRDVEINGVPLDSTRDLTVAVTRFIAEGGDGYGVFLEASGRQDVDVPLRDLFANALKEGLVISGKGPRITAIHSR
jgi:5'-nucleotidase/UDP-sugar diphosphatase